jgi:phosphomannomutase
VDGTFPNHEANPLIEENRRDIVERGRRRQKARHRHRVGRRRRPLLLHRRHGEFIAGDFITALLAEAFLLKHPGATIIYDVRASYAVKDTVARTAARR